MSVNDAAALKRALTDAMIRNIPGQDYNDPFAMGVRFYRPREELDGATAANPQAAIPSDYFVGDEQRNKAGGDGATALHAAAQVGDHALVERLSADEQLVDAATTAQRGERGGKTALMTAAYWGHSEIVDTLLKAGAKVDQGSGIGRTALQYAAEGGDDATVNALLAAGAPVNQASNDGTTALHHAASSGSDEALRSLIAAGASVNAANNNGLTPLHLAAKRHDPAMVRTLLASGAEVDPETREFSPLYMAAKEESAAAVGALL